MVATQLTEESTSRFADIGGRRVHYNEAGSGPAVVMLHGGGPGATGWSNFQRNVGPMSEKHRVLLVDHPGYGQTDFIPPEKEGPSPRASCAVYSISSASTRPAWWATRWAGKTPSPSRSITLSAPTS